MEDATLPEFITDDGAPNVETLETYAQRLRDANATTPEDAEAHLAALPPYARDMVLEYAFPVTVEDVLQSIADKHTFGPTNSDLIQYHVDFCGAADLDQSAFRSWAKRELPERLVDRACAMHSSGRLTPAGRARNILDAINRVLPLLEANPDADRDTVRAALSFHLGSGDAYLLRVLFPHGDHRVPYPRRAVTSADGTSTSLSTDAT